MAKKESDKKEASKASKVIKGKTESKETKSAASRTSGKKKGKS